MRFCPDCGTSHECETEAARGPIPEIEIARINADRDKYVARVQARMGREELETAETIAETEAEAEIVSSEAAAEIIASEDEPEETGEPIVVETAPAPEPEPEPEMVPPVAEPHRAAPKSRGWWDGYS